MSAITREALVADARAVLRQSASEMRNPLGKLQDAINAYNNHLKFNPRTDHYGFIAEISNAAEAMLVQEFDTDPIALEIDGQGVKGVALRLNSRSPLAIPYTTEDQREYIVSHLRGWVFTEPEADRVYRGQAWISAGIDEMQGRRGGLGE